MDVRAAVVGWSEDAPRGAVSRFCEEHGVSRSWFYEVRKRARETDALTAMKPRPRDPGCHAGQAIPVEVEDLAVRIRKELADGGWDHGPVTVRHKLAELGIDPPAASTLARVFTRRGMVTPQPQKRPRSSVRRFEAGMVHECWQLDAFEWPLLDGSTAAVFQLLDDRSRMLLASHVAAGETAEGAMTVVSKAIAAHQVPQRLLSDNGTAFNMSRRGHTTQLVKYLRELGCRPITGRPGHPQSQGKDERVHSTTQRFLTAHPTPADHAELQALLEEFDTVYNHQRPHQSLGMRTPAQALADGPIAIPPLPPIPAPPTAPPIKALVRHADFKGKLKVNYVAIQLGAEFAKGTFTVIATAEHLAIFDTTGTLIRTVNLEPGKTYYGNGRSRRYRLPKPQPSTLT